MVTLKYDGFETNIVYRLPTEKEIYREFKNSLLIEKILGHIFTAQYRNAVGQFKHGDFDSCYGFLRKNNMESIIDKIETFKITEHAYMVTKCKVTFDKPVEMAVIDIDLPKEDK